MLNLSGDAKRTYKLIQARINSGSNAPSIKEIESVLSLSTRKVIAALRELEDSLIIKRSPYKSRSIEIITPIDEQTGRANDETVDVPILGTAPGGPMLLAEQNYEDTLAVPIRLLRGRRDVFLLRVTGSSMSPYLEDGDLALIKKQESASVRDVIVAAVEGSGEGYEATIKEYIPDGDFIVLNPINKEYKPMVLPKDMVKVQGVVIGAIKMFSDN
jgi:repressor LexA